MRGEDSHDNRMPNSYSYTYEVTISSPRWVKEKTEEFVRRLKKKGQESIEGTKLIVRWIRCNTPTCSCRRDLSKYHGPYFYVKLKGVKPAKYVKDVDEELVNFVVSNGRCSLDSEKAKGRRGKSKGELKKHLLS